MSSAVSPGLGPLIFVGGGEWRDGCEFDRDVLAVTGAHEVLVLPTAAAYEHPERTVDAAQAWFSLLDAKVDSVPVLTRRDAESQELADRVREARFIYLADGSLLHLRSVLKKSAVWDALVMAWRSGAAIAGSSAGATILGDPMVDPRGGAFTIGLGLVRKLAVIPDWDRWTGDRARRTTHLAPSGAVVAEIEERSALIRWSDGRWEAAGSGKVILSVDGQTISVDQIKDTAELS